MKTRYRKSLIDHTSIVKQLSEDKCREYLREALEKSNFSENEINLIEKQIFAIVIFGSSEKHAKYEEKGIIWSWKHDADFNDFDIAIIFNGLGIDFKEGEIEVAKDVIFSYDPGGYWATVHNQTGKLQYFHFTLLKDKELKKQLKAKDKHALSIKSGKRLYVRNLKLTKELFS